MSKPSEETELTVESAVPYRAAVEVTDGLPDEAKGFPWVKTVLAASAIIVMIATVYLTREATKAFGVNRARPMKIGIPETEVEKHVRDFGLYRNGPPPQHVISAASETEENDVDASDSLSGPQGDRQP